MPTGRWSGAMGLSSYQQCRNEWHQNGHDAFWSKAASTASQTRSGRQRELVQPGARDEEGTLTYDAGPPRRTSVDLRFEMDTLVLLHTCPHPLNPVPEYPKSRCASSSVTRPGASRRLLLERLRGECRGFKNTELYRGAAPRRAECVMIRESGLSPTQHDTGSGPAASTGSTS